MLLLIITKLKKERRVWCNYLLIHHTRNRMLYIGIDLGTSAVKLLLMDSEGNIQKIVSKEYPLYFP